MCCMAGKVTQKDHPTSELLTDIKVELGYLEET